MLNNLLKEEQMYKDYIKYHEEQNYKTREEYDRKVSGHYRNLRVVQKQIKELQNE